MFEFIKGYVEKRREARRQQWIASAKVFLDKYYKPIPEETPPEGVLDEESEILSREIEFPPRPKEEEEEEQTVQHSSSHTASHSSASSAQPKVRYSISCSHPPPRKEDGDAFRYSINFKDTAYPQKVSDFIGFERYETISDFINTQKEDTFVSELFRHMRCKGYTAPTLYKRANIDKRHYSKIISNTSISPTKDVAIALSFALRLSFTETQAFIGKAGYTLTHSSERDVLIEYCLQEKIYNIHIVNSILAEFNQKALGEK